ncbi:MAG: protein-L-isoaspartate(D-aspartate) O-methyltransferase [archaeon]|nr:protein-L-isoaspartate(D-aspartate) O-methyltransferase [archaeon]
MNEERSRKEREKLVHYISGFAASKQEIKNAFLSVRRENFMEGAPQEAIYGDHAFPIGEGQTISQPSTIAAMLELLGAEEGMEVLEVGSGSGYVLALLSKIVGEKGKVHGIEISESLAQKCKKNLEKEGVKNAEVIKGDGSMGWPKKMEFDRVLFSCACPYIPKTVFDQLKEGGRIVAPVGDEHAQVLEIMEKQKGRPFKKSHEGGIFVFVPLKGEHGFK